MIDTERWVRRAPSRGARARLFLFPFAGGGAQSYRELAAALEQRVVGLEVCRVCPPGREHRIAEPAFASIEPLLDGLRAALDPLLDLPFACFGHSMGALVAFELTRLLRRDPAVRAPSVLVVSGHRGPSLPDPNDPVHGLPDDELLRVLRDYNGTPAAVFESAELLELVLPSLRSDFALCETYTYRDEEPLDVPLCAYGGVDDEDVDHAALDGWGRETRSAFVVRRFDGGHFYLQPERERLTDALVRELEEHLVVVR